MQRPRIATALYLTALGACAPGDALDEPIELGTEQSAIASQEGGVEWSIDAPWRMEPPYTSIPITVTFHDANQQTDEHPLDLQRFCWLGVAELRPNGTWSNTVVRGYAPAQFHEIEASAAWPQEDEVPLHHTLTKVWEGASPEGLLDVSASSEWNATLLYTPTTQTPGQDLVLFTTAIVSKHGDCPPLPTSWSGVEIGHFGNNATFHYFQNTLRVHYGAQALPRFDVPPPLVLDPGIQLAFGKGSLTPWDQTNPWVYGDLHYHAQGTDNEGESALSYRSVVQSMKAMGLDFLFATEHASNSIQLTDLDKIWVDNLPDPWWLPGFLRDYALDQLQGTGPPLEAAHDARRDMSDRRFRYLRAWLNDANGVNLEVGSSGKGRVPQIFLGGEVDAIPEMSAAERDALGLRYGDGLSYAWGSVCGAIPEEIKLALEYTNFHICGGTYGELTWPTPDGTFQIKDVQGMGNDYFARQHLVYLPSDGAREDAFVPSTTSHFGGATRRLKHLLGTDFGQGVEGKGYVFLAHPVAAASGHGAGRLGPDIVPYSDVQLLVALRAPTVLGLQLWNEDTRVVSNAQCGGCYFQMFPGKTISAFAGSLGISLAELWPSATSWQKKAEAGQLSSLYHGAAAWDRMNLWGMTPSITAGITWLAAGQPRRVFMAGGSDAHGDLNYRREGAVFGWSSAVDTAIGKPRNLVHVGTGRPRVVENGQATVSQTQVVDGLRSGNFVVTDGPIVRVALDMNGDGKIGDGDVPMGGVAKPKFGAIPLLVEWKSTPEFGPVTTIDLYVGVQSGGHAGLVYAPKNAGARGPGDGLHAKDYLIGGATYRATDVYVDDRSGKLRITVPPSQGYAGVTKLVLDRAQYPLFDRACTTETIWVPPVCNGTGQCSKPYSYTVDHCTASSFVSPQRVFVRAFARAKGTAVPLINGGSVVVPRFGYSNPVWLLPATFVPPNLPPGTISTSGLAP